MKMKMIDGSLLVVDDEKDLRETLKQDLQEEGYGVEMAEDGDEALKKIKDNGFDLVTLDIRMPGKSWKEVLKTIKQSHPDTWVTMVSVVKDEKTIKEAKELGAGDYIIKSDSLVEDLKEKIETTLTRLFAQQEEVILKQFEKEEEAYLQMEGNLLEKHPGEVVAILEGKVIAHGKDEDEVVKEAY
ncbi:MAG: response regulator [bacterium]